MIRWYVVQREVYKDRMQVEQQSQNLCIFTNAMLTTDGVTTVDGVTLQQATRIKKSTRHAYALYNLFKKHKRHATDGGTIYDNELDKECGGRLKIQFNSGLAPMQMSQVKGRKEFCKITNIFKSQAKSKTTLPQQMVIVGEKDFEKLTQFLQDAANHHKRLTDQASAENQGAIVFADLLSSIEAEADQQPKQPKKSSERKAASGSPQPPAKKGRRYEVPEDSDSAVEDADFVVIREEEQSD